MVLFTTLTVLLMVFGFVIGFFLGVPPAMMAALGAAALLITRTLEPRRLYQEVDWGLLVFFIGLFLIVGGAENAGIVGKLLSLAEHWNLQRLGVFTDARPGEHSNWGEEDLLNRAAVETIRQGGQAFALPNSRMPEGVAVAAILRY